MIAGMESRNRNLQARRGREPKSLPEAHPAKPEPRRQENLFIAGVGSCFVEHGIHFQFRPKLPGCLILESRVPLELTAQLCRVPCGQVSSERRLNVEPPPTFANRECRRQHRVACAITARPCGCRGAEYQRQEIISFSTFCRNNAKFQHQWYVAKSARGAIGRVKRVGRYSS